MLDVKKNTPRGASPGSADDHQSVPVLKKKKSAILARKRGSKDKRKKKRRTLLARLTFEETSPPKEELSAEPSSDAKTAALPRGRADKRAQVSVFVQTTFQKGVRGLIEEFRSMKRFNDLTQMKEFVAQNATGRNRYKDVGCLDNRRVILKIGKVSYIHANYVSTPNHPKRFICTQAPLPKTCADFWHMVVQEKSEAILMLCNFVEQNVSKCAEYFPTSAGSNLYFDGVRVVCKKQDYFDFPIDTKVQVRMTHLDVQVPGQPLHSCIHYHWLDWPDRGVPEADLAPIALLSRLKSCCGPIIVHCSAGIGRTGSIVLLQHAMELIHRPAPILEMRGYLLDLRKERNNSVQTEHQYLYVHQVLLQYFKRAKYLDESTYPYLEDFTKEYRNATRGF
ncbi:hypothetical protein Y032_0060g3184 [Ancylostoma ceylanicum]|uniref:Protein-tyrosine phosphatase n=2 Tax=Ancylostoma ceylanicum TaxID=53326 RepID=A0A016U3Q2_9BILA|nr:hypothetical protein Y032_0060g3184 [Ancylostoma ceylanicum]